jgi:hypothetical protein
VAHVQTRLALPQKISSHCPSTIEIPASVPSRTRDAWTISPHHCEDHICEAVAALNGFSGGVGILSFDLEVGLCGFDFSRMAVAINYYCTVGGIIE